MCRWLNSDAYRIVREHDPKTRKTAYVARIESIPADWPDLAGEAVHALRSALDHLAFALNAKGYAETHGGAAMSEADENASAFPIFGNENNRGEPTNGEDGFRSSTSYRHMPDGARTLIEKLQPYQQGEDFARDPLWVIHALSRIDKHRIDVEISAAPPEQLMSGTFIAVEEAKLGIGGPVYDGKEVSYWVIPEGAPESDMDFHFRRGVALGQGTPIPNAPVVEALRGIRNHIRYRIAFPLDRFL